MRTPTFRELSTEECLSVLRRNHYGRIVFTQNDRVDVEPIHYVLEGESLYLRTSAGTMVSTLGEEPTIAFEVDEVRAPFDWTSVVVKGTAQFVDGEKDRDAYQRALEILRRLDPHTLTASDPTPGRNVILCIAVDELRGRASAP
jgi:nitroimidazol reductase NimA-like FMN-containing flavoprotein (pyridoxamine 5'-phosphate oxidase superfamily)